MPIMRCQIKGRKGWKFGASGKCYIGPDSKSKAAAQGRAIKSQGRDDAAEDFKIQMQYRRQQMAGNKKPKKPQVKKIPAWLYPFPMEREYSKELEWYVDQIGKLIQTTVTPHIQSLIDQRNQNVPEPARSDDWSDDAEKLAGNVILGLDDIQFNKGFTAADIANKTNVWNDKEWRKILKSTFGVDIFQREPWLNEELKSFAKENTALITKMERDLIDDVSTTLQRQIRAGESSGAIAKELEKRVGVSKSRARLIARDQVGKLNGQLTELRQTNIGIEEYKWITAGDERVRDSHKSKNGKIFKWSKPPADTGHPGQDIQCRCYGEPIFDDVFRELGEEVEPIKPEPKERPTGVSIPRDVAIDMILSQIAPGATGLSEAISFINNTQFSSLMMLGRERRVKSVLSMNKGKTFLNVRGVSHLRKFASNNPILIEKALKIASRSKIGVKFSKASKMFKDLEKLGIDSIIGKSDVGHALRNVTREIRRLKLRPKGVAFRSYGPKRKLSPKDKTIEATIFRNQEKIEKSALSRLEKDIRIREEGIRHIKIKEHGILFDKNGNIVRNYIGQESEVPIPRKDYPLFKDNIFSHNHQNNTSFSPSDIRFSLRRNVLETRATSPKYLHTMTRKGDNWYDSVPADYKKVYSGGTTFPNKVKMDSEWMDKFRENYRNVNRNWLIKNKGKFPTNAIEDTWMEDATHLTSKHFAKKFGYSYSRVKLGTTLKLTVPKKTVSELRKEGG